MIVLIPEVAPTRWWQNLLHNQFGLILAAALRGRSDLVVAMLPFHLDTAQWRAVHPRQRRGAGADPDPADTPGSVRARQAP